MPFDPTHIPPVLMLIASIVGAVVVLSWRVRETASPVTMRSLVAPPLAMSTGLFMFIEPHTRIPWSWALASLVLGALVFAVPLARSSKLELKDGQFMMKRSRAFMAILLGLLGVRFALRAYVEQYVTPLQTGAIFFLLAFGAIVRWRVALVLEYRRLLTAGAPAASPTRSS